MGDSKTDVAITDFAQVVEQYCSWAESPFGEHHQEMQTGQKLLAELHLGVLNLPKDLDRGEEFDAPRFSDEWEIVCKRFKNLPMDINWDVFDTCDEGKPVVNALWDDLTDIYRDLKRVL